MSRDRGGVGIGLAALLPIACCLGFPLLAAASVSAAVLVWGGVVVGALAAVALLSCVWLRQRARGGAYAVPLGPGEALHPEHLSTATDRRS